MANAFLTNLAAYWTADETSGNRADSVGSNTLTDNNTVGSAAGVLSNAAQFVAANSEYLSHISNSDLQMGDVGFTLSAWAKVTSTAAIQVIASKYNTTADEREYALLFEDSPSRFTWRISTDGTSGALVNASVTPGTFSTSAFYHLLAWHDPDANLIGLSVNDGTPVTASVSGGSFVGSSVFALGALVAVSAGSLLDGSIDEVGIWKRVLTAEERTFLYNGGAGRTYPFLAGSSSQVLIA